MKLFAIIGMLLPMLLTLRAAGVIELPCVKSAAENGQGYHVSLPFPITPETENFQCEAVIEPVKKLPDQGLRAMLMLSADPFKAGAGKAGSLRAGVEFFKGVSRHAAFLPEGENAVTQLVDDWGRLPAGTPVRIQLSYSRQLQEIKVIYSAAGAPDLIRKFPLEGREFHWKYFSLVSFRPGGSESLRDLARITDFKVDGQELQSAEFRKQPVGIRENTADAPELQAYLDSEVRPALPVPGDPLFNTLDWKNFPHNSFEYAQYETVAVPGRKFPTALRMTGLKRPITFHTVQIAGRRNEKPIRKGDVIFLQFEARCLRSADESGDGQLSVGLVVDGSTWQDWGFVSATVGREWKTYYGYGIAKSDLDAGRLRVHLFLSARHQTVEIGGIAALNLGRDIDVKQLPANQIVYHRPDARWRREAEANIAKFRQGELHLRVIDAQGAPIGNATWKLEMTANAFGFGCYADDAPLLETGPGGDRFRQEFLGLFNRAIVPMFWGPGNAENGRYGWENPACRDRYSRIAAWCHDNRLATQAHVLTWPSSMYVPPEVAELKAAPEKLQARTVAHIQDVIAANGENIDEYQVLNEPCGTREFIDAVGIAGVAGWFKAAKAAAPEKPLLINENGILSKFTDKQDDYEKLIADLLAAGAPIDAIGFQGHIGSGLPPPEILWKTFDRFAKFGKPIHITEFTVGVADEALQAEYTGDFLLAAFSHPAVASVTHWGFYAGKHYDPRVALFRPDWEIKPNGEVYRQLVKEVWNTTEEGNTDSDGNIRLRAFYGDYKLSVTTPGGGQTGVLRFRPGESELTIRL